MRWRASERLSNHPPCFQASRGSGRLRFKRVIEAIHTFKEEVKKTNSRDRVTCTTDVNPSIEDQLKLIIRLPSLSLSNKKASILFFAAPSPDGFSTRRDLSDISTFVSVS